MLTAFYVESWFFDEHPILLQKQFAFRLNFINRAEVIAIKIVLQLSEAVSKIRPIKLCAWQTASVYFFQKCSLLMVKKKKKREMLVVLGILEWQLIFLFQ